jgi:hypothetical protein
MAIEWDRRVKELEAAAATERRQVVAQRSTTRFAAIFAVQAGIALTAHFRTRQDCGRWRGTGSAYESQSRGQGEYMWARSALKTPCARVPIERLWGVGGCVDRLQEAKERETRNWRLPRRQTY